MNSFLRKSLLFGSCVFSVLLPHGEAGEEVDYYSILELVEREDAGEREIKANWRKLSKQYHPDLKGESSREKYKQIQRAYEVLGDRRKRKVYDMRGEEGVEMLEKNPQGGGGQQHFHPFAAFFGNGQASDKGKDDSLVLYVTLEDIFNGAAHYVKYGKQRLCKRCRGTGADTKDDWEKCHKCKGKGKIMQRMQLMPGFVQNVENMCTKCNGKGKVVKKKCTACNGRKVGRTTVQLDVDIEQGLPENHEIRFELEADQYPEKLPGDVIFSIITAPHATFSRNNQVHLAMTKQLTLAEALLGVKYEFKHLDDRRIKVFEDGVIQFGQTKVLKEEGMPKHNVPSERGDLTITYEFKVPTYLSVEQREKIQSVF